MFFIIFFTVSINHGTNFSIEQFPIPALLGLKCVNHPVALLPEDHEGHEGVLLVLQTLWFNFYCVDLITIVFLIFFNLYCFH